MRDTYFAAGLGFEPRYTAPEAVVLPLDDPAMIERGLTIPEKEAFFNYDFIWYRLQHWHQQMHSQNQRCLKRLSRML